MITETTVPAKGHCSRCGKVWTLYEGQGVCQWCSKLASCQTSTTKPRSIKPSRGRKQNQDRDNGHNGYDQLPGDYATYYKVASYYARKALADDQEDLLHDIILTLAGVERNNGHNPFTTATMNRIASRCVADYWFHHYEITAGLDCRHCSKAQRARCKDGYLYTECPKAIRLEYLSKPIIDGEGNTTELGELIADPDSLGMNAWEKENLWKYSYKPRLVEIAMKLHRGEALSIADKTYLCRYRKQEQKPIFQQM